MTVRGTFGKYNNEKNQRDVRTCFETLSQVFLRRKTELRLREDVISSTAL